MANQDRNQLPNKVFCIDLSLGYRQRGLTRKPVLTGEQLSSAKEANGRTARAEASIASTSEGFPEFFEPYHIEESQGEKESEYYFVPNHPEESEGGDEDSEVTFGVNTPSHSTESIRSFKVSEGYQFEAVVQAGEEFFEMSLSHVDMKFLGQFARNVESDGELLGKTLFTLNGSFSMLSGMVTKARKERRLDTTRNTGSIQLYERIIYYARECLDLLETYVLPMVAKYTELKVLSYKLRASCHHLFVLFHNQPPISLKGVQVSTPPGLKSPRAKLDKGKGIDLGSPAPPERPSSVQPTHPLEGGPVGGTPYEPQKAGNADFLIPGIDYRPIALSSFQEATAIAEKVLWGSHPLRLSVKLEFAAFMYDCLHERDRSRQLAKSTIAEVYNAQEGMDDQMFEDAAHLVGLLGKMMRRGLGSGESGAGSSGTRTASPGHLLTYPQQPQVPVASPGMDNPI